MALSFLVLMSASFTSCSEGAEAEDPWGELVDWSRREATTDFERTILGDGVVNDQEFREAFSRFSDCLEGSGFSVEVQEHKGVYTGYFVSPNAENQEGFVDDCAVGTIAAIEILYNDRRVNPQNLNDSERVVVCLKKSGVVHDDYTVQDYEADLSGEGRGLPFESDDERYVDCILNI